VESRRGMTSDQYLRDDGELYGGAIPPKADPLFTPDLVLEDGAFHAMLLALSSSSGVEFYQSITKNLASYLSVQYAVIAELLPSRSRVRSLAFWNGDSFTNEIEWALEHTPCRGVIDGQFSHFPQGLRTLFPEDRPLVELRAESYLGVPLKSPGGEVLGHLYVMDTKSMPREPQSLAVFRLFAALAAKELARQRLDESFRDSEARYKDLFDEAPVAYVHEGLDTKFMSANSAAMRILGLSPEEVVGFIGKSLIPDTPEAQRRVKEALASVESGTDTDGVVLELRRKSDGQPLWLQWWSKPDPSGTSTRTMFVDITERVLMEKEQERLQLHNNYLVDEIKSTHNFDEIIGQSPSMLDMLKKVDRVAKTESTVLVQGETGTGKELIARAIHDRSSRRDGPFVKVNCAALPSGLVESEFFGHVKGAFTGAMQDRKGRFELADGGTIFLDEIGEISPEVQVKLLRVLQENEFERVGGAESIQVNVRVIAATNRDIEADVQNQRFRSDLFYRLNVFPIAVPALRERGGDIPILTSYFVTQLSGVVGTYVDGIDPGTMDRLVRYPWPGNIRELRNILERSLILCEDRILRIGDADLCGSSAELSAVGQSLDEIESAHIRSVLNQTDGVIGGEKGAARILGLPPSTLRSKMTRLGL